MRATGRRSSISKLSLLLAVAFSLLTTSTRPGGAVTPLAPGLFMEYRVELREGGQLSEESFRLDVVEALDDGFWQLELTVGEKDRYRCTYTNAGQAALFSSDRFSQVSHEVAGLWEPMDASSLSLLADMDRMQSMLAAATTEGDSLFTVGGEQWPARIYVLSDSSTSVQRSESVALSRITLSRGRAWICPELPFGGWLSYKEERRTRKISEFGGRRFEGEEAVSLELWTLVNVGFKK